MVLLSLFGTEVGARLLYFVRGKPFRASEVRQRWSDQLDVIHRERRAWDRAAITREDREVLHPYYGFGQVEHFTGALAPKQSGEFLLVVLGGSVAASLIADPEARAALVAEVERSDALGGRHVRVECLANGGFKQPQQVMVLGWLCSLGLEPDGVVNLDGVNEVGLGLANQKAGMHPAFPTVAHWALLAQDALSGDCLEHASALYAARRARAELLERSLSLLLERCAVAVAFLEWRLTGLARTERAESERLLACKIEIAKAARGPRFASNDADPLRLCVETWMRASMHLRACCAGMGIPYLHVLQPTLLDMGSKQWTEQEERFARQAEAYWSEAINEGYPRLRAAGERLRSQGISFCDASRVFAAETGTIYCDVLHFEQPGRIALARFVGGAFREVIDATRPR